ncbi:NAD(P)H-hydrate dehydratase [Vogesella sp. AC12]|uniref:NAD(P)H-hydrate dehydratase n=1 Tax=Vogesella sp. AC12 TaxID=2950550 RepID=UPI00210BA3A9|nr:NAD(P)H-hydrate dehydratase [Vogesella sp. AC12]MCQ4144975.1 NAD(P)H-hydrate dehydratase [Vogesella sp. AC12]
MPENERALIDAAALRQWEQQAAQAGLDLMARAGAAIAHWLRQHYPPPRQLLFAAGSGNNGGDALIAARLLLADYAVSVWQPQPPATAAAQAAEQQYLAAGGRLDSTLSALPPAELLIDGLFGAGLNRPLDVGWLAQIAALDALLCPRVALDVPSGLDAWSGCVQGAALPVDHTLALLCHKPGLFTADGRDYSGRVELLDLDCPPALVPAAQGELLAANLAPLRRRHNSNKGSFGSVSIIGGCAGMGGAALLAGRAALALGAGKVRIHSLDARLSLDPLWPELMIAPLGNTSSLAADEVVAIGPGLGQSPQAHRILASVLAHPGALLLDADALNLLAGDSALQQQLRQRPRPAVITPHPAEAARLLGCSTAAVQQDRLAAVRRLAADLGVIAVLKGAGSLLCGPDGYYRLCAAGNAALASAGQGDILSGSIAALLAQGQDETTAAGNAVWLHASAGDRYLADAGGPIGLRASSTLPLMQQLLNQQLASSDHDHPHRKPPF